MVHLYILVLRMASFSANCKLADRLLLLDDERGISSRVSDWSMWNIVADTSMNRARHAV